MIPDDIERRLLAREIRILNEGLDRTRAVVRSLERRHAARHIIALAKDSLRTMGGDLENLRRRRCGLAPLGPGSRAPRYEQSAMR